MDSRLRSVGSAGWNIPRLHRDRFAADGSQLQRYASRLHDSDADIDRLAQAIQSKSVETWCIFDNTGPGSAAGGYNALDLTARLAQIDASVSAVIAALPRRAATRRTRA